MQKKLKKFLNWSPKISIDKLIDEMIQYELKTIMINSHSKIFVAGHKGMLGFSILRILKKKGYKNLRPIDKKN